MKTLFTAAALAAALVLSPMAAARETETDYTALTDDPAGQMVVTFLDMIFNQGRTEEAFAMFVGDTYIQHNPNFASGPEAAIAALGALPPPEAGAAPRYDIKRVLVDGDLVAVHSHVTFAPGTAGNAVVDIFRLEDGLVVEHWDVVQPVPDEAANENTMF